MPLAWASIVTPTDPVVAAASAFLASGGADPKVSIVVVVPAFNEEKTVAAVVAGIPPDICGQAAAALVVDDGSSDRTAEEAEGAGATVCRLVTNLGQGRALNVGYRIAAAWGARIIVTVDADGQFDLAELPALVAPILAGEADFVNGSRRLGRSENNDRVRQLGLVVFGTLVSVLARARITDPANGLRAFRVEVPEALALRQPQYQTAELLMGAIARGFAVREVAVTVLPRKAGESKKGGNFTYGVGFARTVITTWWAERRRQPPA
jgi:glycosyltransferase involved in cell wall biosynthesis